MTAITAHFVDTFNRAVHQAFADDGYNLRGMVRTETNIVGDTHRFDKLGTVEANTKARHAEVTPLNIDHTNVTATVADYYVPIYGDKLDEKKVISDVIRKYSLEIVNAMGRKSDDIVQTAIEATSNNIAATSGLTIGILKTLRNSLANASVFRRKGNVYVAVGYEAWGDLERLDQFANRDYITTDVFGGGAMEAKSFMGMNIFPWEGLTGAGGSVGQDVTCLAWHESAVGLAINCQPTVEINYIPDKVSTLYNGMLSMGSVIIDENGVYTITSRIQTPS